jgi:1-acyl-sn-glycerol-3-phosphate acyltransferase
MLNTSARREKTDMLDRILYQSGRWIVGAYARLMFDLDIVQHAPLPPGPKIIVANHPTTTDPFLITLLEPGHMSILINKTLFDVPLFGSYLKHAGHLSVDCERGGRPAFEDAKALLSRGRTIGIFPEGDVSPRNGGFHLPHTGAVRLALWANAPIVPVGIYLDRDLIRYVETRVKGKIEIGTWYTNGAYAMTVGDPLQPTGDISDRAYVRVASERLMEHISKLTRESERRLSVIATRRPNWLGSVTARVSDAIWAPRDSVTA